MARASCTFAILVDLQELLEQVDDRELSDMVEITKKLSAGKAKDVLKQLEGKPTTTASSSSALSAIGTNASSTSSTTAGTATGVSDDTQYRADKMKQDMNQRYDNLYAVLNNNQQYNPLDILRKKNSDAGNGGGAGGGVSSATTLGSGSKSGTIRSKKGHAGAGDVWRVAPGEIGTTTWTSASSSQLIPVEVGAGENGRVPGSAASGTGGGTSTSQDLLSPGSATSATSTPSPASRRNGDGTMSEAATPTTADTKGNKKWSDIFAKRVKKQTSVASVGRSVLSDVMVVCGGLWISLSHMFFCLPTV